MKNKQGIFNIGLALTIMIGMIGFVPMLTANAQVNIIINELDSDTPSTDMLEFIELYDGGVGNTSLDGLVVVLFNGSVDVSYGAFDLDGFNTDEDGYFLLGNTAVVPTPSITFPSNTLQNGADAVALYSGNATDFPNGTLVTTTNLIDAVVYDTNDPDDSGLLILLNSGQPQVDEAGGGNSAGDSIQRCPIGSGGARNTETFITAEPSPGAENCPQTAPKINEFSANTTDTDYEYFEIFGSPTSDYSAYTFIVLEGDAGSALGAIDVAISIGTTDANGLYLNNLAANTIENGTITMLLVKDFTGTVGQDLDTNDDGVLDMTPWAELTDSVAVNDGGTEDLTYALPVLGVAYDGLPYAPGGASRIPDGYDTESPDDWMRNDFDLYGIPGYEGSPVMGEAINTPGAFNEAYIPSEQAPYVMSTVPANGGTSAKDGDIVITFSEPVTVTDGWFGISCSVSGTHTATVTDADPVYTLNPDADFTGGEICTVTIDHEKVNDDDLDDPPDYMLENYTFTFDVAYACGDPYTAISAIQGNGMSTPLSSQTVSTEGIVVADYQTNAYVSGTRNGFFMQSVTPDDDLDTSEGLFVYTTALDVAVGDHVRVTGKATEYNDLTELSPVSQIQVCSSGNSVTPTSFALPATSLLDFERLEGMLVTIPQDLVISEYFNFDRYNEILLATQRFMTYTAVNEPSVDGFAAWQSTLQLNSITLDDGRETQNSNPAIHPNGQPFTLDNRFRGGDLVSAVTGVMDYEFSKYRIQPTQGAIYTPANPRPDSPELAPGDLTIASFNVLNYFTTIDTGAFICGPSGDMECRGADTPDELTRQRAKILAALSGIDADIFGIMEIENDKPLGVGESPDYAVADLVAGLNETYGEGTFAYIATGAIGTDAIKQAIIYKPAAVTPVGDFQLLTTAVDSRFIDTLNRPVLAQVFEDNFTGETFVVAVNHLKSKGSACPDDPDLLDGQGNCNLTRKNAALALVDWLANPEYFLDVENALIIGDLNSYDHEDPIDMIKLGADDTADTDDDYSDMMAELRGESAYGYVYDGQIGYLDYALANVSLAERIVDVNFWHINADEPDLIDYDMTFKQDAQDELYAPDAYRSSDHDPVVISISFNAAPVAEDMEVSTPEDTAVDITLDVSDANDDPLTAEIVTGPMHGALVVEGLVVTYTPDADYNGPDSFTYKVSDDELESNEATVSVTVTPVNDAPVAVSFEVELQENSSVEFSLLASDVDGDTLTFSFASGPAHGTLNCAGAICTYTPDARWSGTDSFIFTANDGLLDSNEATVTLNVIPLPRIYLPIIFR